MISKKVCRNSVTYSSKDYYRVLRNDPGRYAVLCNSGLYDPSLMSNRQLRRVFVQNRRIRELLDNDVKRVV